MLTQVITRELLLAAHGISWEFVFSVVAFFPCLFGSLVSMWVTTLSTFINVTSLLPWFSISMKEVGKSGMSLTVKINHTNTLSFENWNWNIRFKYKFYLLSFLRKGTGVTSLAFILPDFEISLICIYKCLEIYYFAFEYLLTTYMSENFLFMSSLISITFLWRQAL